MKNLEKKIEQTLLSIKENEFLSNKKTLKEQSQSESCSRSENESIRFVFNVNRNVKWTFRKGIDNTLMRVFSDKWMDDADHPKGIYNLENEGRSVINKLNTHYTCFCVLMKDINQLLRKNNLPEIKIIGESPKKQLEETNRMLQIIDKYGERIFDTNSNTFKNLMSILSKTHSLGEKRENITVQKLKNLFGEDNVKKIGSLTSEEDMVQGVDVEIMDSGKRITGQIKPMSRIETVNGKTTIYDSGSTKKYTTDWMIFNKGDKVLVFDNSSSNLVNGDYVFPETALIYSL